MSTNNSIQVAIKIRPIDRNKDSKCFWSVEDNSIQPLLSQTEPYYFGMTSDFSTILFLISNSLKFIEFNRLSPIVDHIFDQDASNQEVFTTMAQHMVHQAIKGYNGTIFAYGQTSSGKTYTMMGDEENPGVIVLTVKEIFKAMASAPDRQFLVR